MSAQNLVAIRDAYGDALAELGAHNKKIVVLESDVGSSTKSIVFGKAFPERYFNVGIAELNMTAMAAGFATCGLIPFTNAFSVFVALRAGDPANSLIAYDKLNVKLVGMFSGLSDSYDGASHHSLGDIAVLRAIPNMAVISVCDAVETRKAVFAASEYDGPVYLRLSRTPSPVIFDDSYDFTIGKAVTLRRGTDLTIISTGYLVHESLKACEILARQGIQARAVNVHTVKPLDDELVLRCAKETGAILTAEEHSIYGGLGSAVAEVCAANCPVPMEFVGLSDYSESGNYFELLDKHGLTGEAIAERAKRLIGRKA